MANMGHYYQNAHMRLSKSDTTGPSTTNLTEAIMKSGRNASNNVNDRATRSENMQYARGKAEKKGNDAERGAGEARKQRRSGRIN